MEQTKVPFPDESHDRELRSAVRPADWVNPRPRERYDLVVLGAGTAGLVTAAGAAGLGASVALVERSLMGGDCLNTGCVPSKCLLRSARSAAEVRDAGRFGIRVPEGVEVDFAAVMERMRRVRSGLARHDSAMRFRDELGVDVFLGEGRFAERDRVEVDGRILRFRKAVVATGGRPVLPHVPGLPAAGALTSQTVFDLDRRPRRLAVIGGGPLGCEMAQAFRRLGSAVTLLERGPQVLPREDADVAAIVEGALRRDGVEVVLGCQVLRVDGEAEGRTIRLRCGEGERTVAADAILAGTGRAPNVEGIGLEAAGVLFDTAQGVRVDDRLRTTNPRIFAAGDVCFPFRFTHAADALARIAVQNALFLGRKRVSAMTIPWCTYTDPEVAHVGLDARRAGALGHDADTVTIPMGAVDRAVIDGETEGLVRVLYAKRGGRILGATIVARHAGETIAEVGVAMRAGLGLGALSGVIHPYPTQAEALRKAADAYNRGRLTAAARRVLALVLRWS